MDKTLRNKIEKIIHEPILKHPKSLEEGRKEILKTTEQILYLIKEEKKRENLTLSKKED